MLYSFKGILYGSEECMHYTYGIWHCSRHWRYTVNRCAGHWPTWNCPARRVGRGGEQNCVRVRAQREGELGSGDIQKCEVKAQVWGVRDVFLVEDMFELGTDG